MRRRRRGRCGWNETKGGGVGVIGRKVGGKMRRSKRRRRGRRGGGREEEGRMGRRMGG